MSLTLEEKDIKPLTGNEMVHIRNICGSQLEVATVGLILEKDATTTDSFRLNKMHDSSEIKKLLNMHFIQLLSEEQVLSEKAAAELANLAKQATIKPASDLFFEDIDEIGLQQIEAAAAKVREGLSILDTLISGKKSAATKKPVKTLPEGETKEAGESTKASSEGKDENSSSLDDEWLPDNPPAGMTARNDPAKKFLGLPPFNSGMTYDEKKKFLSDCHDIGILREIAIFEKQGPMRTLVRQRLKDVKKVAGA